MIWNDPQFSRHAISKVQLVIFALSIVCFVLPAYGQTKPVQTPPGKYPARELHGGIEISPRGAQGIGLRITGEDETLNVSILYSELILSTLTVTDGKFTPESIRDMTVTVQKLMRRLQQDFKIPVENIYITGTSGLIASNVQELVNEVRLKTGRTMTLLDVETSVQLSIAGSIPRRYKLNNRWYDNRNASLLIEVAANKVQGGYQVNRMSEFGGGQTFDFVTFELPKGTAVVASEANKTAGAQADRQAFARTGQSLMEGSVRAPLRAEATKKLGLTTRKKVYLAGPIVRIMMATLFTEDQRTFIPITTNDINTFYNRLIADPDKLLSPDLSKIQSDEFRQIQENGLQTAKIALSVKEMIAGAEILRAIASELELQNKQIFFPRFHHLGRILSFVRLQPEEAR
ncbi:MAG: hypothetical protein ACKVZH_09295 [Blastocatellia bacterium]